MPRRPRRETRAERTQRLHGTLLCSQCRAPWRGVHADGCDPAKRGIHSLWDVYRMAHTAGLHAAAAVEDCPLCPRPAPPSGW